MIIGIIAALIFLPGCGEETQTGETSGEYVSFSLNAPDYGITNYSLRFEKNLLESTNSYYGAGIPSFSCELREYGSVFMETGTIQASSFALTPANKSNADYITLTILPDFEDRAKFYPLASIRLANRILADYGVVFPDQLYIQSGNITLSERGAVGERMAGTFNCTLIDSDTYKTNIVLTNGRFSLLRVQ